MNEVGGSDSGRGLRAVVKSSRTSETNFEYDDSEWDDVGIGNLISDLDADIEKTIEATRSSTSTSNSNTSSSLNHHNHHHHHHHHHHRISSGSSNLQQMHIPQSPATSTTTGNSLTKGKLGNTPATTVSSPTTTTLTQQHPASTITTGKVASNPSLDSSQGSTGTSSTVISVVSMEHSTMADKGLKMKIKRSKPGTKSVDAKHEIVKNDVLMTSHGTSSVSIPISLSHSNSGTVSVKNSTTNNTSETKSNVIMSHVQKDVGIGKDSLNKSDKDLPPISSANSSTTDSTGNHTDDLLNLNSSKSKSNKRAPSSTHKKIKLATGVTASIVSTKKEVLTSSHDTTPNKSSNNNTTTTSASINSHTGNHAKDGFGTTTTGSSSSGILNLSNIGTTSAFVKTSGGSGSSLKIPITGSQTSSIHHSNELGTTGCSLASTGNTTNCRSLHTSTSSGNSNLSSHNFSSSGSGSGTSGGSHLQISSPTKIDKSGMAPSIVASSTFTDKGSSINSPTYGKKPRVSSTAYVPSDKNLGTDTNSTSTISSSLAYRNLSCSSTVIGNNETSPNVLNSTPGSSSLPTGNTNVINSSGSKENLSLSSSGINSRALMQPQTGPVSFQDACVGTTVGTVTEPDCLGPCEPGTSVTLEGIVWHETESGVLVVNVTWRGKTYVGTLLDCTKNDWASPRFCDSPTSDLEMRTPKNRGKRGRAQTATPVSDPGTIDTTKSSSTKLRNGAKGRRGNATGTPAFVAPVSPLKPDQWPKRKTRGSETEGQDDTSTITTITGKRTKRLKLNKESGGRGSGSPAPGDGSSGPYSPARIECPEPNCSKKYTHINGLRYHQSHAHSNNFVTEDSDSNMSTASNTNLNSAADSTGPNDDGQGERLDVDAIEGSGAESNSAPTTPVKKQVIKSETEEKTDKEVEASGEILKSGTGRDSELKNSVAAKLLPGILGKTPSSEKEDVNEKNSEKNDNSSAGNTKDKELPVQSCGISSRTPILTVPTLPFISLQNRNQHHSSIHRTGNMDSSSSDKPPIRDHQDPPPNKGIGINSTPTSIPLPIINPIATPSISKGIPWQPHAISPFHSNQVPPPQPLNIPVTLNVPMGSSLSMSRCGDHDKSSKDFKSGSISGGSGSLCKKPKHKKKSKDKSSDKERDRGRDGKPKSSMDYGSLMGRESSSLKSGMFSPNSGNPITSLQQLNEKDPRNIKREVVSPRRDLMDTGLDSLGENREDPQSPAYSDISDANDSGPESEMKDPGKSSGDGSLKKDGPPSGGGPGLSSFYSPFYTPMDSPYLSSSNPSAPAQVKSERNPTGSGLQSDDSITNKHKSKSLAPSQPHITGHLDDRTSRSPPKVDYHHPKYLPSQQPYFGYPYPNYHFDQPFGLLSDNSYSSHNRSIIEEKERETEERVRLNSKGRDHGCGKDEPSPTNLSSVTIKQEPGLEQRGIGSGRSTMDDIPVKVSSHLPDPKSDFGGSEYQESKRHGAPPGMSHYGHSSSSSMSKHTKDSRRDREDRHPRESGDGGKEAAKISSRSASSEHSSRGKSGDDRNSTVEKDSKNEGAKPTMETQGPPPPPTAGSYAYYPPGYLQGNPYSLPFDPNHHIFRMVQGPYPGAPYMHPRFSQPPTATPLPEDLSRSNPSSAPPKALDLLSHHAAQYYATHKIHELQERALKSPSPQINPNREVSGPGPTNLSGTPSSPSSGLSGRGSIGTGSSIPDRKQPTDLTKDVKPTLNPLTGSSSGTENSRSPPIHHVHTHMHSHTHIGYPIIPTVPPQYSPNLTHYGVLTTPSAAPPSSVIPPFTSQKPS